jgi:hypothetical protein
LLAICPLLVQGRRATKRSVRVETPPGGRGRQTHYVMEEDGRAFVRTRQDTDRRERDASRNHRSLYLRQHSHEGHVSEICREREQRHIFA